MAQIKKKKERKAPGISTSSLPDIIFILLFFFMVVTVLREMEIKVQNKLPQATELTKLQRKSLVSHIYIGKPKPKYADQLGTAPRLQLNDSFAKLEQIPNYVQTERNTVPAKLADQMTFALKVDQDTEMGIVSDVKLKLRKSDALKINYAARKDIDN